MALGEATDSVREKIKTPMPRLTQSRGRGVSWVGGGVQVVVHHWNVEVNHYIIHTRKRSVLFHMF